MICENPMLSALDFLLIKGDERMERRIDCQTDKAFQMNRTIRQWLKQYDAIRQQLNHSK